MGGRGRRCSVFTVAYLKPEEELAPNSETENEVLVCTTTLAMGVNTPATDVVVRDTVFHGYGRLTVSDIQANDGPCRTRATASHATVLFPAQRGIGVNTLPTSNQERLMLCAHSYWGAKAMGT